MKLKHGAALVLTGFLLAGCGAHEPQEELTVKDVVNTSSLLEDPLTEEEVNTQLKHQIVKFETKNGTIYEFASDGKLSHVGFDEGVRESEEVKEKTRGEYPTKERVETLRKAFVPKDYTGLRTEPTYGGDNAYYTYFKENPWGIENRYQGVRFIFSTYKDAVESIDIYNEYDVTEAPKISSEEATETARRFLQEVLGEKAKGEPKELKLLVRPSIGYFDDFLTKEEKARAKESFGGYGKKGYHVVYHVWFGRTIVFVDAYDGSIVDGDYYISDGEDDANDVASDG